MRSDAFDEGLPSYTATDAARFRSTAVLIGQLYDVWNTYIEHGSQSGSAGIRTWATLPLFMQGEPDLRGRACVNR